MPFVKDYNISALMKVSSSFYKGTTKLNVTLKGCIAKLEMLVLADSSGVIQPYFTKIDYASN
jgi:hypothetical protein